MLLHSGYIHTILSALKGFQGATEIDQYRTALEAITHNIRKLEREAEAAQKEKNPSIKFAEAVTALKQLKVSHEHHKKKNDVSTMLSIRTPQADTGKIKKGTG